METNGNLEQRLEAYPKLRRRFEEILSLVEEGRADLKTADEVEEEVCEQVRRMGLEVLQDWALGRQAGQEAAWNSRVGVTRKEKKQSGG